MDRTAAQIRRAFENITPDVLDRVITQGYHKKGVVIPMKEKKSLIPVVLQKIASAAAIVVLLIAIGVVALMILNGRTNPQLSENPTEEPTDAPVEINREGLKLNATKLDKEGKEIGTTLISIHVTKGNDNQITDIEIDPFDDWKGLALPIDSTTGEKFQIQQVTDYVTESLNMATLGGFTADNRYQFCTLYFTDDFEYLILCMLSNVNYDADHHYYVAAGNDSTAGEILEHFRGLGVSIFPTKAPPDLAEDELVAFNALFGNMGSWYNKALLCQYTSPAQLKLKVLFYSGFAGESQKPTDAEWAELMDQPGFDINYDLIRLPADKMNQVLTDYFGITLDEIDDAGFENLVFLESTNCYYHMASDAMAVENFKATAVETQENGAIRVSYTAGYNDAAYVVTLMPNGEGYRILSNEQA